MKLQSPFVITPRLAPGLRIADSNGTAWLSFEDGQFVIDLPDGTEHVVTDFRFPQGRIAGDTDLDVLAKGFSAILSFLTACAESRRYAVARGRDAMEGENSDLFPPEVGKWAESVSDELSMLQLEIDEAEESLLVEDND